MLKDSETIKSWDRRRLILKCYLTPTFQSVINPFVILAKNEYRTL